MRKILDTNHRVLLEIGPGQALRSLALLQPGGRDCVVLPTLRCAYEREPDLAVLLSTMGRLWAAGVLIDWPAVERDLGRKIHGIR